MLTRRRLKLRRRNSRQYQRTIVSAIHNMSVSSRVLCADQNACHGSQVFSLKSDCRAMSKPGIYQYTFDLLDKKLRSEAEIAATHQFLELVYVFSSSVVRKRYLDVKESIEMRCVSFQEGSRLQRSSKSQMEIINPDSGIRALLPWIGNMAPDTRTTEIKRLEDSIESVKREANTKYDKLVSIMKDQGQKWDHTANTHEAQIEGNKDLLHGLTQQLELVMQRFPSPSSESSQSKDKHTAYQNEPSFKPN
ncbi:hypothetical protein POTOM_044469 [Populus tomentosa]|uniref:Uncharacterized protein n=1 Tax=Populus tomentosa TaxID=118781 RepID=A0A8X7YG89_POPTO|nr:hypothetical protein POTOM_044469 [Populus tomentosa]